MIQPAYRALIVDDEVLLRNLVARALTSEGFDCDLAIDGQQAREFIECRNYDAVITDLRMPRKNGHELIVELLELENRPMICVLTGVLDPSIAEDLMSRGIEDIMFKPIDFGAFASKLKAMIHRDRPLPCAANGRIERPNQVSTGATRRVAADDDDLRLLSECQTAQDVLNLVEAADSEIDEIASAVVENGPVVQQILREADAGDIESEKPAIADVARAIELLGRKRVAEIALIHSVDAIFSGTMFP